VTRPLRSALKAISERPPLKKYKVLINKARSNEMNWKSGMSLAQLVYTSKLNYDAFPQNFPLGEELKRILERARIRNSEIMVTGILLYNAGQFLQVLEGRPLVLNRLYERISADARHSQIERLAMLHVEDRMFEHWYMGMLNLDECQEIDHEMFERFVQDVRFVASDASAKSRVIALLREFKSALDDLTVVQ
jgi:hypothetical protein